MVMRSAGLFVVLAAAVVAPADAQIWRWVDAQGTTHFSSSPPPAGVQGRIVDAEAKSGSAAGAPAEVPAECHTVRCQGERLEARLERREAELAKAQAERAAAAPRPVRGLEFRKYVSLQRGMSEGEVLVIAGEPDLVSDQGIAIAAPSTVQLAPGVRSAARVGLSMKTWTWLPTPADPFTTTLTLVGGRISELERVRKF